MRRQGPIARRRPRWRIGLAVLALASVLAGGAHAAQPAQRSESSGISPPGANDFSCRPTSAHPRPVVLVHGTFGDMTVSWNLISPALKAKGYCVFALNYGNRATQAIEDSAAELRDFIRRVRRATDANTVSLVGHSQGGMMPRYYVKFLAGDTKVGDLIGLSPSNHGTTNPFAPLVTGRCPACRQQIAGSSFLEKLNAGDETPGRVSYTQIQTRNDTIVTPYTSAFLAPGARTTNVLLQDRCELDPVGHVGIIYDPVALRWIKNALGRPGPADPAFRPRCLL
jgi:triacylglycerol esterase/lipase EstA (alpha/beta hydrolase family)